MIWRCRPQRLPTARGTTWLPLYDGSIRAIYVDGVMAGYDLPSGHSVPCSPNMKIGLPVPLAAREVPSFSMAVWMKYGYGMWAGRNVRSTIHELRNHQYRKIGLVANYHFNQGIPSGTNNLVPYNTLNDASGNGNNGTLTNLALTGGSSIGFREVV